MNAIKNLVYNLLNAAGLTYLWADEMVQDTIVALRHALVRYSIFSAGLVILAALIGRGGYMSRTIDANGSLSAMTYAEHFAVWLFALNYFIGAVLIGIMIFRALPFLFGIPAATGIARAILDNSPLKLDLGVDTAKDSYQLVSRGLWATAVSLQLFGLFMTIVPIYRSFTAFLLVLGSVALIAFAVIGRGVGGEWFNKFLMANIIVAVTVIAFCVLHVIFPNLLSGMSSRFDGLWTSFVGMETVARESYIMGVLWFIAIVGAIASLIYLGYHFFFTEEKKIAWKVVGLWVVLFLFLVFLGPRTVDAANEAFNWLGDRTPTNFNTSNSGSVTTSTATAVGKGISVSANREIQSTGIVVKAGDKVKVSATGSVMWDPNLPQVGQSGTSVPCSNMPQSKDFPLPTAGCGALVMKVGGNYYPTDDGVIVVKKGGEIKLDVNDRFYARGDNSGTFNAVVEVSK